MCIYKLSKPGHTQTVYPREVFDNSGNLITIDRQWLMPKDTFTMYQLFAQIKEDSVLQGATPLDIFRMYIYASEKNDMDTLYGLLDQAPQEKKPNIHWAQFKKMYFLHEARNANNAVIRLIPQSGAADLIEKRILFHKNEHDVWKIEWPVLHRIL